MLFDNNFDAIAEAIATGLLDALNAEGVIQENYYRVQVGLFRNWRYAERLRNELLEQDYPAFIDDSGPFISVQVGGYDNLSDAVAMERRLKMDGYDTLIIS